jgi:hypothetical protein
MRIIQTTLGVEKDSYEKKKKSDFLKQQFFLPSHLSVGVEEELIFKYSFAQF